MGASVALFVSLLVVVTATGSLLLFAALSSAHRSALCDQPLNVFNLVRCTRACLRGVRWAPTACVWQAAGAYLVIAAAVFSTEWALRTPGALGAWTVPLRLTLLGGLCALVVAGNILFFNAQPCTADAPPAWWTEGVYQTSLFVVVGLDCGLPVLALLSWLRAPQVCALFCWPLRIARRASDRHIAGRCGRHHGRRALVGTLAPRASVFKIGHHLCGARRWYSAAIGSRRQWIERYGSGPPPASLDHVARLPHTPSVRADYSHI